MYRFQLNQSFVYFWDNQELIILKLSAAIK